MTENIPKLVGEALHEANDLARKEFALFRTAVFAILALIWLTQALVDWLATMVGSHALAALIVGGVLALIAIGLGLYGRNAMAKTSLAPTRTVQSIQRDKEVLTESVSK
jgi:hypothetical protein